MKTISLVLILAFASTFSSRAVWINEFHYDNTGGDVGEFIEIAGLAGTSLADYSLVLYNGTGGASYSTISLSGNIPSQLNGFGTLSFAAVGIQNGAPDGLALVDPSAVVIQFLSYEGTFQAVGGPADGLTSTDVGVIESGSDAVGWSLQLVGTGSVYSDFTWAPPMAATSGAPNTGQNFLVSSVPDTGSSALMLSVPLFGLCILRRIRPRTS